MKLNTVSYIIVELKLSTMVIRLKKEKKMNHRIIVTQVMMKVTSNETEGIFREFNRG